MDRALWKAKRIDNGEWVEGYYVPWWDFDSGKQVLIHSIYWHEIENGLNITDRAEVDSPTLCQCTGLKDKNGNMIFEGDIVTNKTKTLGRYKGYDMEVYFNLKMQHTGLYMQEFSEYISKHTESDSLILTEPKCKHLEIIGNKHDEVK